MEFKIDTKLSYTLIKPLFNHLDANLTDVIRQKWVELVSTGSQNLILDLEDVSGIDEEAIASMINLHEQLYSQHQSFVLTRVQNEVLPVLKKSGADLALHIAPRLEEAVDIISMDILERDLFNEEQ
jgi:anti-anti-sigma factor